MKISLIAASLWLIAFFCSFGWIEKFEMEFVFVSFVFLFGAMAINDFQGIEKREWKFYSSPVLWAGGAFWLTAAVGVIASQIIFNSWTYFVFFSVLPLTIIFFLIGDNHETKFEYVWRGIMMILAGLSCYALYQYIFRQETLMGGRVHDPFRDPNGLAASLSLGIFLLLGKFLRPHAWQSPHETVTYGILLCLLCAAMLTTASRGAILILLLGGALLILSYGIRNVPKKAWGMAAAALVIAAITIGIIYKPVVPQIGDTSLFKVMMYRASWQGGWTHILDERWTIWESALELVKAYPWFGIGSGNFKYYYPELRDLTDATAGFMVHNDPLQFAVEWGIWAPIFFYVTCILAGMRTIKVLKLVGIGAGDRLKILAPFFGLMVMVIHSHITFNFHSMPCLFLTGYSFAFWYFTTAKVKNEELYMLPAPNFIGHSSLKTLPLLLAIIMMVLIGAPLYSQRLSESALNNLEAGNLQSFADDVNRADAISMGTNASVLVLAAGIPLGILEQTDNTVTEKDKKDFMAQIHSLLNRAERNNPRNADVYWMKGRLAKIENKDIDEEKYLKDAIRINPAHMSARLSLADHYEKEGRLDKAADVLNSGIDVRYSPKDAQRYFEYYMRAEHMKERLAKKGKSESRKVP